MEQRGCYLIKVSQELNIDEIFIQPCHKKQTAIDLSVLSDEYNQLRLETEISPQATLEDPTIYLIWGSLGFCFFIVSVKLYWQQSQNEVL